MNDIEITVRSAMKGGKTIVSCAIGHMLLMARIPNTLVDPDIKTTGDMISKAMHLPSLAGRRAYISAEPIVRLPTETRETEIRDAVLDFHFALDNREHMSVAAGVALRRIEVALGMNWLPGEEARKRAANLV